MNGQLVLGVIVVVFITLYVWYRSVMRAPVSGFAPTAPAVRVDGAVAAGRAFSTVRPLAEGALDPGALRAAGVPEGLALGLGAAAAAGTDALGAAVRDGFSALGGPLRRRGAPWVVLVVGSDPGGAMDAVAGRERREGRSVLCAAPGRAGGPAMDGRDPGEGIRRALGAAIARGVEVLVCAPLVGTPSDAALAAVVAAAEAVAAGSPHEVLFVTADVAGPVPAATTGLVWIRPLDAGALGATPSRPVRLVALPDAGLVDFDPPAFARAWVG